MCEIRQNQPDCRHPYPPLTHFSHSLWFFYLICLLQTTQSNLVQSVHSHAYSNSSQRWVKRRGRTCQDIWVRREKKCSLLSVVMTAVVDPVLLWFLFVFFKPSATVYATAFIQFQPVSCYHGNISLLPSQLFLLSTFSLSFI